MATAEQVISWNAAWSVEQSDLLTWLPTLPEQCVDLTVFSPPYELARLYLEDGQNLGIARKTEEWVAWMVDVINACLRVTKGLVACVVAGQTKGFRWSAAPALLMADLHRAGIHLRTPPIFHRIGIPGSGGPDWWRNDYEFIICATNGGKLPWSDNTATGHPPKWAPGGEMAHRLTNGMRVNQWGKNGSPRGGGNKRADGTIDDRIRPSHFDANAAAGTDGEPTLIDDEPLATVPAIGGKFDSMTSRAKNGEKKIAGGRKLRTKGGSPKDSCKGRRVPAGVSVDGELLTEDAYLPPVLANPGNSVEDVYTASEVAAILEQQADYLHGIVGGGVMGSDYAHENEAPYPEWLVEPFVRCFCPPHGIVLDPFAGSGTTLAVARKWGRRAIGCDLRASQVELTTKRLQTECVSLFDAIPQMER